jgi:hypothetical protein
MPSLKSLGDRNRLKTAKIEPVPGFDVELTYRPGMITLANDTSTTDDDPDAPSVVARRFCGYATPDGNDVPGLVCDWDITGPLDNTFTGEELVPDGEVVPLDPAIVQHLPYALLAGLNQEMVRAETPNLRTRRR